MHKRCTIHAAWERRHWMIDENLDCDVFRKRSTLMPYAGYYLLCHIYKINIIKISWISAFYSYLNLKYLPSAFRMKMLWLRVTISSGSCRLIPLIQIRQKVWFSHLIGCKISSFTWPWTWPHSSLKWSCISAASERLIEKQRFFSRNFTLFLATKKKIYTINMKPISLKSPFN